MTISTNLAAIRRGRAVLDDYAEQNAEDERVEVAMAAMLADLQHFASARGINWARTVAAAENSFQESMIAQARRHG